MPPATAPHPEPTEPDPAAARQAARTERFLAILDGLVEKANDISDHIHKQAVIQSYASSTEQHKDFTVPFACIATTIRRTMLMSERLSNPPKQRAEPSFAPRLAVATPTAAPTAPRPWRPSDEADILERLESDDLDELETIELLERLEDLDELDDDAEVEPKFDPQSKESILEQVCKGLGIEVPDAAYWAQEPPVAPSEAVPRHPPAPSG